MNNPWVCPRCGKVNAPWRSHCDCHETAAATITTTTEPNKHECSHHYVFLTEYGNQRQYVCLGCGKIKLVQKGGDTDGDL